MPFRTYLIQFTATVVLLIPAHAGAAAAEVSIPSGWQIPNGAELGESWRDHDHERNAVVRADFNGDGRIDQARLLVRTSDRGFGLFVSLSGHKKDAWRQVYVDNDMEHLAATGISKVSPGRYETACGKGYGSCQKGEKPQLTLAYDAIEYFKTESAASYFFFNPRKNAFERIWISD